NQSMLNAKVVLTNLEASTNEIYVQADIGGRMTDTKILVFNIDQTEVNDEQPIITEQITNEIDEKEMDTSSDHADQTIHNEEKKAELPEETIVQDNSSEKTTVKADEETNNQATIPIVPFSGNLNVDIDLSPQKSSVLA